MPTTVAVRETGESLGVREDVVDRFDERVGRQAAVRLAEVHRPARGDDAHAELLRGANLRLDQAGDAAREDVVVVEDRRAPGERELGDAGARRGVEHLVVDARPGRVERLQPGEEVRLLRPGARERLVEVVVRVDEPRCDDGAGEILGALRRVARAELGDQPVLEPDPAALVLGARVVAGQHPRVAEDHSTSSGTSSKRSTSTSPRSVSFRDGITDSARNARCWNGASSSQPSSRAAAITACDASSTSASGASESRPATGSGSSASTSAPSTTTMPPPRFASRRDGGRHRRVVHPDDDDVVRVVRDRRCERAALQAEAAYEAEPDAARAQVPLDDGDLGEVALGVRQRLSGPVRRRVHERVRQDLARHDPDHARVAARPRDAEHLGAERADPDRVPHPVGHLRLGDLCGRTAALEHGLGHEALEVGQDEQVGVVAGCDGTEVREAVPERRAERRRRQRVLRRDAERDGIAHHRVDVAVVCDVLGLAVVGAERDPSRAVLGEERQERLQVARRRALTNQEPHAGAQPLAALVDRVRLVVRADAGRGVGHQRAAEHAGRVAVDVLREAELRELRRRTADHAGEVHHLGDADHAPTAQQRVEVAGAQPPPRRLEVATRARTTTP